jgi:4-amino-4-deoxy-L-arabinose transferase-like glycosyltransferase
MLLFLKILFSVGSEKLILKNHLRFASLYIMQSNTKQLQFLIIALAIVCFFPFLGAVHLFDWDEINFAECAREMIVSDDYLHVQMGFEPFHEKPPLFIWMQVLSMKIFGINEFAARFPNAICGLISLLFIFHIGKKVHTKERAYWWVIAYGCSILPHFYFKSGIMDPWFNLFQFSSLYFFYLFYCNQPQKQYRHLVFAAILLGAAMMIKGPVALLIAGVCIVLFILQQTRKLQKVEGFSLPNYTKWVSLLAIYFGIACLPLMIWYAIDIIQNGPSLFYSFIEYQIRLFRTEDAGHGGFFGYHVVVLLFGCFPASLFAIHTLIKKLDTKSAFKDFMLILLAVVLVLFSIVQSKIIHYSSLCYFPLTYLAACSLQAFVERRYAIPKALFISLFAISSLYAIILWLAPWLGKNLDLLQPLLKKDAFAAANVNAELAWRGYEILPAILFSVMIGATFYFWIIPKQIVKGLFCCFLASVIMVQGIFYCFITKVEGITQGAAIQFFESLRGKDVFVHPFGYFSYAHYFYANTKKGNSIQRGDGEAEFQLFHGNISKDVYFSVKNTNEKNIQGKDLIRLYERNGFVFYKREANNN